MIYAHRGVHDNKSVFENTITSFKLALEDKLNIELDVRLTRDDKAVVFHDTDLKRLLKENANVKDLTYDELQQYKLGEDTIPLLEDVLSLVDGKVSLLVEIKNAKNKLRLSKKTYELLQHYEGSYQIQSFSPLVLFWFRLKNRRINRGQLLMPIKRYPNIIIGLLMNSMLAHLFTWPQFYAFEKNMGQHKLSRTYYEFFAKEYAIWTLSPGEKSCLLHNKTSIQKIKPKETD